MKLSAVSRYYSSVPFCFFFVRVVVLDKVTDFILFLGQLTITAGLGESFLLLLHLLTLDRSTEYSLTEITHTKVRKMTFASDHKNWFSCRIWRVIIKLTLTKRLL